MRRTAIPANKLLSNKYVRNGDEEIEEIVDVYG